MPEGAGVRGAWLPRALLVAVFALACVAGSPVGVAAAALAGSHEAPVAAFEATPSPSPADDPAGAEESSVRIPWPIGLLALSGVMSVGLLVGRLRARD